MVREMTAGLSGETGAMTPDPSLVRVTYVPHRRSVYPEVLTQHFRVSLRLNRHISAIYTQHNQNYTSPTFKLTDRGHQTRLLLRHYGTDPISHHYQMIAGPLNPCYGPL